ncbi:unnamed protein product [Amoebophrya sp. A120]|nr:unnamed protein product [Amoebophrya sp. A120]|eukprot:GSA120T00005507001.1
MAKMMSKMGMKKMGLGMKKMAEAKVVSKVAKKRRIYAVRRKVVKGEMKRTGGGLEKPDLRKKVTGKCVSVKVVAAVKKSKQYKKVIAWNAAFMKARKELKLEGFVPCGGKTAKGKAFLATTRKFYKA